MVQLIFLAFMATLGIVLHPDVAGLYLGCSEGFGGICLNKSNNYVMRARACVCVCGGGG